MKFTYPCAQIADSTLYESKQANISEEIGKRNIIKADIIK